MKFKQHIPIQVKKFSETEWPFPKHSHDHFELVLIEKGEGVHYINNSPVQYHDSSIYLLKPDDSHYFDVRTQTEFILVKFSEQFLNDKSGASLNGKWSEKMDSACSMSNISQGGIQLNKEDRDFSRLLIQKIQTEFAESRKYHDDIMAGCLGTVLSIIARSNQSSHRKSKPQKESNCSKITQIINLVRKKISMGEDVKIRDIASQFNMSENYISIYFKKHTGESLKSYILMQRLYTAQFFLKNNDETISEIAFKMGFFDESHFHRLFKKEFGISPKEFRNENHEIVIK